MAYFSSKKSTEKALVVVTTRFWPKDLETIATIGPLIPLSKNTLLKVFLVARKEKLVLVFITNLIRIRRLDETRFNYSFFRALVFFLTIVYS